MLAVIVPRAWRANIDSKYGLVRQACTELASFGMEWAEQQSQAQIDSDAATIKDYLDTLDLWWVSVPITNWTGITIPVNNRSSNPEATVHDMIPPEKVPRNPFTGASVFANANNPAALTNVVPGAIFCGAVNENAPATTGYQYYAFLFQGTDSNVYVLTGGQRMFHGGMDDLDATVEIEELRNGVFFARLR